MTDDPFNRGPLRQILIARCVAFALIATACAGDPAVEQSQFEPATSEPTSEDTKVDPLLIGISIHVEGWQQEATNHDMFEIHRDGLLLLAQEVAAGGGVLTFELSDVFMDAVEQWDDDTLTDLQALGHSIAVHADVGGRGDTSLVGLTEALTGKREALAALGIDTTHVSGICSMGPWVEAALAAGFTTTNGGVAYCATSMDPTLVAPADQWVFDCTDPASCHGAPPLDDDRRYHPFYADSSADWMVSEAADGLLVISSESGHSLPCLDRSLPNEADRCVATAADLEIASATLDEYLEAREPGETTALVYSWSIGAIPEAGMGTAVVETFVDAVASGDAIWIGVDEIGAVVDGTVEFVPAEPAEADPEPASTEAALTTVISVHTHLDRDWEPYTDTMMTTIDADLLAATVDLLGATAGLLDDYGISANFQMSYGVASALCSTDEGLSLIDLLQGAGHEIGMHTHGVEYVAQTYDALVDDCGVVPATASGISFSIASDPSSSAGATAWLEEVDAHGLTTVLAGLGLSDNPRSQVCSSYGGETMEADANALLHSWLADPTDLCTADPSGALAVVTHSDRDTRALAEVETPFDNVGTDDFALWALQLRAAIDAADTGSTWGIVMALPAMMTDGHADRAFLAAFDVFLADLAASMEAGTITNATASEAAAQLR
ncbi:MAG: hypothetical protein P8J50_09185 [Acidimicrobiales bacterium]|nr:hypothetical protein [Acidimicrobiales bacterium]